ncbi:hypothetical protein B0H14DRAFT_3545085 [Mycena olivaceomarginata]|nr:hypothetical protein B0H14DRAFT_3545085 [Mycena olivaceomarginata]
MAMPVPVIPLPAAPGGGVRLPNPPGNPVSLADVGNPHCICTEWSRPATNTVSHFGEYQSHSLSRYNCPPEYALTISTDFATATAAKRSQAVGDDWMAYSIYFIRDGLLCLFEKAVSFADPEQLIRVLKNWGLAFVVWDNTIMLVDARRYCR